MFGKIVVATDLSEASAQVLRCVEGLRAVGASEAILVHVLSVRDVGALALRLRELARPSIEAQQRALEEMGYRVRAELPIGEPYYEIDKLARESGASILVLGSHGAGIARGVLLGSVSAEVLHHTTIPVLLVRLQLVQEEGGKRCAAVCEEPLARVLFPTDFSDTAERAFHYVERIVEEAHPAVTLLHVQDRSRIEPHLLHRLEEFNATDRARLERLSARLHALGAKELSIEILYGFAAPSIIERAAGHSLIVMGSQGRGFIRGEFLGSVTQKVVRHAPTPVLVVPPIRSE